MKYFNFRTLLFIAILATFGVALKAQIPTGYYDAAEGKTSYGLKTELFFIIDGHTNRGYSALWDLYPVSDIRADGFLWDIYSNCDFEFGTDQDNGTGGTTECDKYNREHTFPQSWFNSASTPRADAHMVLPTDKKINGQRANLPYGETNGSTVSSNGAKLGSNIISGYNGTIFEPADEYKGDIARIYFYMATRYEDQIDGWDTNSSEADIVLNGTSNVVYEEWTLNMLLAWHENDPVSQKEIDRNNDVYDFQGNRNPFVDHPEYVSCIWQNSCNNANDPTLETNISSINYGAVEFGSSKRIKNFNLSGQNLSSDISISSNNSDFLISTSSAGNFTTNFSLSPDNTGTLNTTIYVAFEASENISQNVSGQIAISQSEVEDLSLSLTATTQAIVNNDIEMNFVLDTVYATISEVNYSIQVQANKKVEEDKSIEVKISDFKNIFYPAQFSTDPVAEGTSIFINMLSGDSIAFLDISLDTAQLKTNEVKSFTLNLISNNSFQLASPSALYFEIEAYETSIPTAISNSKFKTVGLQNNPVQDNLIFTSSIDLAEFKIYNAAGALILTGKSTLLEQISVTDLNAGLYWVMIKSKIDKNILTAKFLKE